MINFFIDLKRRYYNDPVKKCDLYKEMGCSHVDGMLCDFPDCSMNYYYKEMKKKKIPELPKPPLTRFIREGCTHLCPNCHSSAVRKPWFFGKRYCINPDCKHYFEPIIKTR